MHSKKLWAIIALIIALTTGVVLFEIDGSGNTPLIDISNQGNKVKPDEKIESIFNGLEIDTKIKFTQPENSQFSWKSTFAGQPATVQGYEIRADNVLVEKTNNVTKFFESRGYSTDPSNNSADINFAQTGVVSGTTACLIQKRVSVDKADTFVDTLVVKCGSIQR